MEISLDGMSAVLLTWVACSLDPSLMEISQDGMSSTLLKWVPCSVLHPLVGISLDGVSVVPVKCIRCLLNVVSVANTSQEGQGERCVVELST